MVKYYLLNTSSFRPLLFVTLNTTEGNNSESNLDLIIEKYEDGEEEELFGKIK